MKKILSIILTLAIIASAIFVLPLFSTNAEQTEKIENAYDWDIVDTYTNIFDTATNYPAPEHVNTNIVTDTDAGLWLGAANLSANVNNRAHLYLGSWKTTNEILSRNKVTPSDVKDFEWTFDYKGTDTNGSGNVRSAFLFHTNSNSDLTTYWTRNYAFSLMVWGKDWSYAGTNNQAATDYAMPHSIALQVPVYSPTDANMNGKPRPMGGYSKDATSGKYKHDSADTYLELGDIDLSQWATITIKMVGTKITLTVEQGNIKLSKEFNVSENYLLNAPAGDFAIIQGGNQSAYKNMTIDYSHLVYDSNISAINQNPGNAEQNGVGGAITASDDVYTLPRYATTNEIIESSMGYEANLTDFVFETEFAIDNSEANADFAGPTFNFHVDKDRADTPSKLPGDEGITGIDHNNRRFMQGVGIYGDGMELNDTLGTSGVALQSSIHPTTGTPGFVMACQRVSVPKKDGSANYSHAASSVPLSRSLQKNVYYTLRIVLSGKNLYTYIWETDNKAATLCSVYHKLTDAQLASAVSGDFAILNQNRILNVKNMRIYDSVEVLRSAEDYSKYTDILDPTVYDFEDGTVGDLVKGSNLDATLAVSNGKLQLHDADDTSAVSAENFDNGNANLKDFIMTFDFETATGYNSVNSLDWVFFRNVDTRNYYKLEIKRDKRDANKNYDYIRIVKRTNGTDEVIGQTSLSRAFEVGVSFKIKLEVIGNVYKVYVGNDQIFNIPALVCIDTAEAVGGSMRLYHNNGISYFDNICIYDITATELASAINNVTEGEIKRGMDGQINSLYTALNGMHSAQIAKLSAQKDALDTASVTLENIEMKAHDINGDDIVDICDLVNLDAYFKGSDDLLKNPTADPLFDDTLDDNDLSELRAWLLGSKKKITKILCIGNSYTQDTMTYVAQLADSMGIDDFYFANLYSPGRDIPKHYASALSVFGETYPELLEKYENNPYYQNGDYLYWYEKYTKDGRTYTEHVTIKEALLDNDWDIVFFQTSPTGAAFTSGFEKLDNLMDFVRSYEGNDVKFMWHNSWAYATLDYDANSFDYDDAVETTQCTYTAFKGEDGNYSQDVMHGLIVNKFASLFGEGGTYSNAITIDDVIPSGMAIQNARESGVDFKVGNEKYWDLSRDGYHLSKNMGRYIGSLTLLRHFTGKDLVYSDEIFRSLENGEATEEQVRAAIDAVNLAFAQREALK